MTDTTIMVIDDESAIREMIAVALDFSGYQCVQAQDSHVAHDLLTRNKPHLILLDWMLPGISGIDFARRIRRVDTLKDIPIIMLTAKDDENCKVQALDIGADDYITKPFSMRELISRIKAVLRRTYQQELGQPIQFEKLALDPVSCRVTIAGAPIHLGPTEYRLLEFLMTHPERAFSRTQLLDRVWGDGVFVEDRTVDVHIRRLRKILTDSGFDRWIQTVRGIGYRFSQKL